MEVPPTPLEFENQIVKKNIPPKTQKDYNFTSNKKNSFNVIFNNCSNYIQIKSVFEKDSEKNEYEQILFLEELKSNKYLSICDTIDQMYEQIITELNNNNDKIKIIEENNKIDIIIPIKHVKVKEIKFTLNEKIKIKTQQELIQELFEEIKEIKIDAKETKEQCIKLENENKNLKEEITLLKEENKKLNDKIDSLIKNNIKKKDKNNLNQNKIIINDENIKLSSDDDILKESSIINSNINGLNQIKKWIEEKTDNHDINFKLIFKMSKHGYEGKEFRIYCDNEAPTLILIKSKNNHVFGGFTPLSWGKENKPIDNSNQTFVFSLDRNKKFDILNPKEHAIRCRKNEGPVFGNCDIKVGEDMRKIDFYSRGNGNYFSKDNLEITGETGEKTSLEALELEVYNLIN